MNTLTIPSILSNSQLEKFVSDAISFALYHGKEVNDYTFEESIIVTEQGKKREITVQAGFYYYLGKIELAKDKKAFNKLEAVIYENESGILLKTETLEFQQRVEEYFDKINEKVDYDREVQESQDYYREIVLG